MARDMAIAEALYQHVLGAGDPSGSLVRDGRFPPEWVEEYRRLLKLAEGEWLAEPLWPRCLAVALYYVVTHLDVRYRAWSNFEAVVGTRRPKATSRTQAAGLGSSLPSAFRRLARTLPDLSRSGPSPPSEPSRVIH